MGGQACAKKKGDRNALVPAMSREWGVQTEVHLEHGYHPTFSTKLQRLMPYRKIVKGWRLNLEKQLLRNEEYPCWYRVWMNRDEEEIEEK